LNDRISEEAGMENAMRLFAVMIVCGAVLGAQGTTRQPIEGVWKVNEMVVTGADASTVSNAQPSLFIFAKTHYSMMYVPGNKPRALSKAEDATTEEKLAAYDSFVANTGTYEVSGSALTIQPIVARNPNFMASGFDKYQFRIDGNTLSLTEKSTDLNLRIGQRVMPSKGAISEIRMKLVRLE
jgi:hypothetical protein